MYCVLLLVCYSVSYLKQILTSIELSNSSDLDLSPKLKLVPGRSYVEYRADENPAQVMCSSQRRFEHHTIFVGRSTSLLLILDSTFTSFHKFLQQIIVQELVGKRIPHNWKAQGEPRG